jgi:hypothetical protein
MKYEEEYSTPTSQHYGSSEVVNIGFMIDQAWQYCWPKVIARAWTYQHKFPENAAKTENRESLHMPTQADRWYADLLSQDALRTKQALEAEGMVFLAAQHTEQEHWEHWVFTRMLVRAYDQQFKLDVTMEPHRQLQEQLKSNANLPTTQRAELERRVSKLSKLREYTLKGYEKQIPADDHQQLTDLQKLQETPNPNDGLFYLLDPRSTPESFKRYQSSSTNSYARQFPWDDIKATGHYAVLTLPPKPAALHLFAKALADYKATANIYPLS